MTDAYIYDAVRTPRGKGRPDGALHEVSSVALSAGVLNAVKARNGLDGHAVEDVIWGNVTQVGEQGGCLARSAVLLSDLDQSIPGLAINRFCASGMEAVNLAANQVKGGAGQAYIAGGVEMMGRVAMGSDGAAIAVDPSLAMKTYFVPQGISADIIATEYGFTRDMADALAVESQRRAALAWVENRFARSIVPVTDRNGLTILAHDEYMRPSTDMTTLAALKPAFGGASAAANQAVARQRYPQLDQIPAVHTAGSSSGIVDGASLVLVGNAQVERELGLRPRARILGTGLSTVDPTLMLTGPVSATQKALAKANLDVAQIDLFEVNEAFAAVPLYFVKELNVSLDKINVNGGSIAMGHPIGATGAMILGTLLDELERRQLRYGVATLCVAGGMGVATVIERI